MNHKEKLEEAAKIINMLRMYGHIHTVKGVIHSEGTHDEFIKKAESFLRANYEVKNGVYKIKPYEHTVLP